MLDFHKSIQIPVFIDRPESLRSALQQYQQHLATGTAFNKGQFDIEFVVQEENSTRRLQFRDIESEHWRKLAYIAYQQGPESWTFKDDETIKDDDELYVSEAILFAISLQHESVIGELLNTAEAIVAYARKYNDTSAMWTDDMRVFGTEALFLLACHNSQYLTLLAQFLFPTGTTNTPEATAITSLILFISTAGAGMLSTPISGVITAPCVTRCMAMSGRATLTINHWVTT